MFYTRKIKYLVKLLKIVLIAGQLPPNGLSCLGYRTPRSSQNKFQVVEPRLFAQPDSWRAKVKHEGRETNGRTDRQTKTKTNNNQRIVRLQSHYCLVCRRVGSCTEVLCYHPSFQLGRCTHRICLRIILFVLSWLSHWSSTHGMYWWLITSVIIIFRLSYIKLNRCKAGMDKLQPA